jgi:hypothetical protein
MSPTSFAKGTRWTKMKGRGAEIGATKRGKGMKTRLWIATVEYHPQNFLGFVQLACLILLFRRLLFPS